MRNYWSPHKDHGVRASTKTRTYSGKKALAWGAAILYGIVLLTGCEHQPQSDLERTVQEATQKHTLTPAYQNAPSLQELTARYVPAYRPE